MKVTIITVTYNSAHTLSRAIRSVCRQSYHDVEYIIVDGESADNTLQIIKDYASQYANIRYISEPDKGIYDAINKGIRMATGDIVGLVNSDDALADSSILEKVVAQMENTQSDILYGDLVYCRYQAIEHNPPRIIRYWQSAPFSLKLLRRGWMPPHPTLYCKREVFERVGLYRTDFRISADYEFMLRALSDNSLKKVYLPEVVTMMEVGGVSNRDLRSLCIKFSEDIRVMRVHHLNVVWSILYKNLSKLNQFFRKS